jgi:hypothetical protein
MPALFEAVARRPPPVIDRSKRTGETAEQRVSGFCWRTRRKRQVLRQTCLFTGGVLFRDVRSRGKAAIVVP